MNEVKEIIEKIKKVAEGTELYRKMQIRGGQFVIHKGSENPDILFVGEAGGKKEDKCGMPFVGRSGKVLDEWIKFTNNKNIAVINAVPIMPEENGGIRKPTKEEIDLFRPTFIKLIFALKPKRIIMLGRSANEICLSKMLNNLEWDRKVLLKHGIVDFGFIYHPSYYIRRGGNGKHDFIKLISKMTPIK